MKQPKQVLLLLSSKDGDEGMKQHLSLAKFATGDSVIIVKPPFTYALITVPSRGGKQWLETILKEHEEVILFFFVGIQLYPHPDEIFKIFLTLKGGLSKT